MIPEVFKKMTKVMRVWLIFFILLVLSNLSQAQNLTGRWQTNRVHFYPHLGYRGEKSKAWFEFSEDTLTSSLGFYFPIVRYEDDTTFFKYKFVYYGNKEKYWIKNDSLYIHRYSKHGALKYKLTIINPNKFKIASDDNEETVFERILKPRNYVHEIISFHVYVGLGDFHPTYNVTIAQDSLVFEEIDYIASQNKTEKFKLSSKHFKSFCERFNEIDLTTIRENYESSSSHGFFTRIRINLKSGYSIISGFDLGHAPELFEYACIPLIYSYHLFKYKDTKPVE
jgi:hypothetical protein